MSLLANYSLLNTESSLYYIVGIVGDSNAAGRAANPGPTTAPGTCYEYDEVNNSLVELTTDDISTTNGVYGSFAKQFAMDHFARTGQPVVFVPGGVPSATFAYTGDTNNWLPAPTGVNYGNFVSKMTGCLTLLGRSRPDAIIASLGINDVADGVSNANFQSAVQSLFDRLDADYNGTPKLWIQIGRTTTTVNSQSLYDKRSIMIQEGESRSQHALCGQALSYVFNSGYEADNIHYNNDSMNAAGSGFDRFFSLSSITNKWAKSYLASLYTVPTTVVRGALVDLITESYNDGEFFEWEGLCFGINDDVRNVPVDVTFLSSSQIVNGTFNVNSSVGLNGTDAFWASSLTPQFFDRALSDDVVIMSKILTNRDNNGLTPGSLFQLANGTGDHIGLQQSGANALIYRLNDSTISSTGLIQFFADNTYYSIERTGGTKAINENSTLVASVSVPVTNVPQNTIPFGRQNINGVPGNYLDCDLQVMFAARRQGINLPKLISLIETVVNAY